MAHTQAVLFISFGGPEKPEDIMPFLETVTRGRGIPAERLREVAHHYELIGGKSPINEITRRQAEALRQELTARGRPRPVYIGQRNWHPFLEDTLRQMAADGIQRAVGFTTAAHRCEASLERYVAAVEAARAKVGSNAPAIDFVGPWFDHPLFIQAIAACADDALQKIPAERRSQAAWIFTAHSIPCGMAKESTYVPELRRTAALVCKILRHTASPSVQAMGDIHGSLVEGGWSLAYSSRSGNPSDPWLEPDVCDAILEHARRGVKDILLIPIGFVADHVEVLFDLDIEAKFAASDAGVRLYRARTVGENPFFVRLMADKVRERENDTARAEQRSSGFTIYQDGMREEKIGPASEGCYCKPEAENPPCRRATAHAATPGGKA